jgi:hypothetical protein
VEGSVKFLGGKGWRVAIASGMMGLAMLATRAQFNNGNSQVNSTRPGDMERMHNPDEEPYAVRDMQAKQLRRLREEHQKEVFSDTNRLVQLATSLKTQVEKGNMAALDVIKDADEIGKLAKRVSDRIKTQ